MDGRWWDVDVTANDCGDDVTHREYSTILWDPTEPSSFRDETPQLTKIAQELLVPGSTK